MKLLTSIAIALSLSLNLSTAIAKEAAAAPNNEQLAEQWMNYLASDELKGRLTGSDENSEVQDWLIERFETIGIQKLPGQDSYLQKFTANDKEGTPLQAANVIGYLPCHCESDRYFFVGAHYDHVGVNLELEGDQIFNGADDDASGVVASLIFAKQLKQYDSLPFNVVIAAWDAEEMGLQGSKYFAQNPWVPLNQIESGFMFELVGVPLKDKLNSAWMTGDKYSTLYPIMKAQLEQQGWTLDPVLDPRMGLFFRSDNAPFAMLDASDEDIKQAFQNKKTAVVTGIPMHAISVWRGQNHYHQPNDDASIIHIPNLVSLAEALAKGFKKLPDETQVDWLENPQFEFSRPE